MPPITHLFISRIEMGEMKRAVYAMIAAADAVGCSNAGKERVFYHEMAFSVIAHLPASKAAFNT